MTETTPQRVNLNDRCREVFDRLAGRGIQRFWLVNRTGGLVASAPELEPIASEIEALPDFNDHEGIFIEFNREARCIYAAFVHSTVRGQAQGGVRVLDDEHYGSFQNLIVDGLRLARGMTEKNSLAALWWGGGKGIICPVDENVEAFAPSAEDPYPAKRKLMFENYGKFIASIGGIYVTAEDMNTSPEDMKTIHTQCRFVTCLPPALGGSSNPSGFTAEGTFLAMQAGMQHLQPEDAHPLSGKKVLLQGAGNVGYPLLCRLVEEGAHVVVFEPNVRTCRQIQTEFNAEQVTIWDAMTAEGFERFVTAEADVFSPNAIGAVITADRIPNMKVRLIAGAANNQLKTRDLARQLHQCGILYLPDFLINCMGIVNCANEQYGYTENKISEEVHRLRERVEELLAESSSDRSVYELAIARSRELAGQPHPIWPGNGRELIEALVDSGWCESR